MITPIQQPNLPQPAQPRQEKDPLDDILRGLQLANGAFGLAVNYQQFQAAREGRAQSAELQPLRVKELEGQNQLRTQQAAGLQAEQARQAEAAPFQQRQLAAQTSASEDALRQSQQAAPFQQRKLVAETLAVEGRPAQEQLKVEAEKIKGTDALRNEWASHQVTKSTVVVADAFEKIKGAAERKTAAGDVSLIFGNMKINDPGSTVREGEFATAENSAGVPERVRALYNRVLTGERLSDAQREDFVKTSEVLYRVHADRQEAVNEQFLGIAAQRGLDPKNIINTSIFRGSSAAPAAPTESPRSPRQERTSFDRPVVEDYARTHGLSVQEATDLLNQRKRGQ